MRIRFFCSVVFVLALLCAQSGWASTDGDISGTVVNPSGQAVPGVQVKLMTKDGKVLREVQTDAEGKFHFISTLLGDYEVSAELPGFQKEVYGVHVAGGGITSTDIHLTPEQPVGQPKEMVVQVKAKKRLVHTSSSSSSSEISQAEIKKLPQGSEISLPKLLSSTTAGVARGPFGQLFFRGNHANIQYQIDGVQLPDSPSNTFGQAFSPRNIDHMEVITGGIPAEYGQRLGAVVNIVTKSGTEAPSGELELNYGSYNTISPHLMYGGTNNNGNLRYFFSLNYNGTDRGIDTPNPVSQTDQTQGGRDAVHDRAYGNSEFARVDWQMDNKNKLIFSAYHSYSKYQIPNYPSNFKITDNFFSSDFEDSSDNSFRPSHESHDHDEDEHPLHTFVPSDTDNTHAETNFFAQAVWKHTLTARSFFQLAPYYRYSQVVSNNDLANDLYSLGRITGAQPTSFNQNRHVNNLGLKGDFSTRPLDSHLLKAGFQLQASASSGYFNVYRSPTRVYSNSDPANGYYESVYLQDDITIAKPVVFNLGVRFDATQFVFSGENSSDYMFQPRVGVNFLLSDSTKIHLFYGKLFQPAPLENLRSTFDQINPNPAPYDIKAEKVDYYEFGIAHQLFEKQVVSLTFYYKDGINFLDNAQLFRTPIAQPFNFAKGFGYGAEFALKGQLNAYWSEYLNYAYTMSKGQGLSGGAWASDHPNPPGYQVLDHVQHHTANAGLTYTNKGFWWTTQGVLGSGLRTGHENDIQLPMHVTMDTTVGYEFGRARLSFDVLNVFDNAYPITVANSYNGSHYAAGRQFFLRLALLL